MPQRTLLTLIAAVTLVGTWVAAAAADTASPATKVAAKGDFHVSPAGDDAGPGSDAKPFATIARARDAVRAKIAAGLTGDVRVLICGGTYRQTEPLVLSQADGGDDKHSVTYAAQAGEKVVISGGVEITGWRDWGDGTWSAVVPYALLPRESDWDANASDDSAPQPRRAFNELFVGGQRRTPARHPNAGYLRVDKPVDPRRSFLFSAGDIPAVGDANRVTLVYLHDWEITRVAVASVDRATRTLTTKYDVGCKADYWRICGYEPHPRYFVEGAKEFLDAPGEWWLDRMCMVLYRPMPGEKLDGFSTVAPLARQLLVIRGDGPDKPVRNLHFLGLTFEHCAWSPAGWRYAGSQAGFHFTGKENDDSGRGAMTAAVEVQNARGVDFSGCTFRHLGGSGVWLGRGCRDSAIAGCTVTDVGGNGVMLGEPSAREAETGNSGGNTVRGCTIERCGAVYYGAVGIWVGLSGQNYIGNNEIRDLPYTGISVGWMWNPTPTPCKGNLVSDNHIHHVMQILSDGGGIYTLGRQPGTKLTGNWIHDVPVNAGRAESNGMFLDEGSTDLLIENNLIHDVARSPLRFHKAGVNLVKANVLVRGKGSPPVRYNVTPEANIKLEGNSTPEAVPTGEPVPGEQAKTIRDAAGPGKHGERP
jgi:hypothetical protein